MVSSFAHWFFASAALDKRQEKKKSKCDAKERLATNLFSLLFFFCYPVRARAQLANQRLDGVPDECSGESLHRSGRERGRDGARDGIVRRGFLRGRADLSPPRGRLEASKHWSRVRKRNRFPRFPTPFRRSIRNSIEPDRRIRFGNSRWGLGIAKERKWGCRKAILKGEAEKQRQEKKEREEEEGKKGRRRPSSETPLRRRSCRFHSLALTFDPSLFFQKKKTDLGPRRHRGKPHRRPHLPLRSRGLDAPDLGGLSEVVLRRRWWRRRGGDGEEEGRCFFFCCQRCRRFLQGRRRNGGLLPGPVFLLFPPQEDPPAGLGAPFALPPQLARGDSEPPPSGQQQRRQRQQRQQPPEQPRRVQPRSRRRLRASSPPALLLRGGLLLVRGRRRRAEQQQGRLLGGRELRLCRLRRRRRRGRAPLESVGPFLRLRRRRRRRRRKWKCQGRRRPRRRGVVRLPRALGSPFVFVFQQSRKRKQRGSPAAGLLARLAVLRCQKQGLGRQQQKAVPLLALPSPHRDLVERRHLHAHARPSLERPGRRRRGRHRRSGSGSEERRQRRQRQRQQRQPAGQARLGAQLGRGAPGRDVRHRGA